MGDYPCVCGHGASNHDANGGYGCTTKMDGAWCECERYELGSSPLTGREVEKGPYRVELDPGTHYFRFIRDGNGAKVVCLPGDLANLAHELCKHLNAAFLAGRAGAIRRLPVAGEGEGR